MWKTLEISQEIIKMGLTYVAHASHLFAAHRYRSTVWQPRSCRDHWRFPETAFSILNNSECEIKVTYNPTMTIDKNKESTNKQPAAYVSRARDKWLA